MSVYFSRYNLNTYRTTPYFRANLPEGYPILEVMERARAFRRLPEHVRELSALAKQWSQKNHADRGDISDYYDEDGYELDYSTGDRLSDDEVDELWPQPAPDVDAEDIPVPEGGFPDPETWQEPLTAPEDGGDDSADEISEEQVLSDIRGRGQERTFRTYHVPPDVTAGWSGKTDEELAKLIAAGPGGGATLSTDALGHEHKGKGSREGGQFTSKGTGGDSSGTAPRSPPSRKPGRPADQSPPRAVPDLDGPKTRIGRLWKSLFGKAETSSASGKNLSSPMDSETVADILSGASTHELSAGGLAGSYTDTALTGVLSETGRAGVPHLVSAAQMDALVAKGWTPAYRALDSSDHTDQFKSGELHNGAGIYGNGTYVARRRSWQSTEAGALEEVQGYGSHRMRMAVPPNARVVKHGSLLKERAAYYDELGARLKDRSIDMQQYQRMMAVVEDLGRFAALRNYDMIDASTASGSGYCVVLNRSMLAVQEDNV